MIDYISRHRRLFVGLAIVAIIILYFAHLNTYHLIDLDEGRYHRIPMEMALSGNFIVPTFDYMPYIEKPILQYWVTAIVMSIFGFADWTGRFLPALTGAATIGLAWWLGRMMFNGRAAVFSAIILATSALQIILSSIGVLDMANTFFIDLAFVAFYAFREYDKKGYILLFYAAMALAMLTKGLIGIIFPCSIIFLFIVLTREWRMILKLLYLPGILLFLVISVPWYYLVCQDVPDFFYFFFIREHFLRFATKMHVRFHPWYYFVPVLLGGFMPWTGFLASLFSLRGIVRAPESRRQRQAVWFLLLWAGLIYIFYTISSSKLPTYILPCWLPLSVLLGASLDRCCQVKAWLGHGFAINNVLCFVFSLAGFGYIYYTTAMTDLDYMDANQFITTALPLTTSLLVGTIAALWAWRKKRDFLIVTAILAVMSYGFALGCHPIQAQIHNNKSAYDVSQTVKSLKTTDTVVVDYGEFAPGLVYYLDEPVVISGFGGEMEFGLNHTDRQGMSLSDDELKALWESDRRVIIVTTPKVEENLYDALGTTPPAIKNGPYLAFTNRR